MQKLCLNLCQGAYWSKRLKWSNFKLKTAQKALGLPKLSKKKKSFKESGTS